MRDHRRPEQKSAGESVFIAASRLDNGAKDTAEKAPQNVITVDEGLVECAVRHGVGVRIDQTIKPHKTGGISLMNSMRSISIFLTACQTAMRERALYSA